MPFELMACAPADVIETLSIAIQRAKGDDRLAPVTVIVPTNVAGVMARRSLGRGPGILGIDMITLNRLAELLAGPRLAGAKRQPVSTPLLDLTVRRVLDEAPGSYAAVAHHPATVVALRELHRELRLAGEAGAERLAESGRGREAVRVSRAVTRMLQRRWYDEADLLAGAAERVASGDTTGLDRIVFHLPQPLPGVAASFVERLAADRTIAIVSDFTGDDDADIEQHRLLDRLGIPRPASDSPAPRAHPRPAHVVSTTDADDEVRVAVRAVIDAARGELTGTPVPFERIAVLWPAQRPYARLVEHHLTADGIPWNGRGGTEVSERIAPRLLLDLLDVDRRGLQRRPLFEWLADVPAVDSDGRPLRTAEWERVSRRAGVSRDEDWIPRLDALARNDRWHAAATSLRDFVVEFRESLGHPSARRPWGEWVDWCEHQLDRWLGRRAIARFSDAEYRAWEALMGALERVRSLDSVADPITRSEFRTVLENELDEAGVREGRIGTGVAIGSLASAAGLVIDVAIVVGAADGLLPPGPRSDPLLSTADRERAGLSSPDERVRRLHHEFVATLQSTHTIVTMPRGDLRSTTSNQLTRWLAEFDPADVDDIDSSLVGLRRLAFPPCERERRLRDRLRRTTAAEPLSDLDPTVRADPVAQRGIALSNGRRSDHLTVYDGDLSSVGIAPLAEPADSNRRAPTPVSPTQLEQWVSCPHAYFVRYLLGVRPVDEPDSQVTINPLDRGLVQHDVLDALHRDVLSGALPQPTATGWTDEHRQALLAHFDSVCAAAEISGRTGRPATWASARERMRRDLLGWFEHDSEIIRANRSTILASEHRFPDSADPATPPIVLTLPDRRHLPMQGSIDRLDRTGDGRLVVTDHKTGKAGGYRQLERSDPTLGGTVFQLPTYAAAAMAVAGLTRSDGARVRAEYSMFERGNYERIGIDFDDEVWSLVGDALDHVVSGIESGWFPQIPPAPGFRIYTECLYCEPDELGTTDAFDRWTTKRVDERIARWFADDESHDEVES